MEQSVARTTPYATSSTIQETTPRSLGSGTESDSTPVLTVRDAVKEYFKDIPELVEVARCESRFRQYDKNGAVLRGEANKGDIGVMQINIYYHEEQAQKLGLDLYTTEGNMSYARSLYEREGLTPWSSSSKCWRSKVGELALAR